MINNNKNSYFFLFCSAMKPQNKFRPINAAEKEIIQTSLLKFNPNLLNLLNKEFFTYISINFIWKTQNYPLLYLISHKQRDFTENFGNLECIYSAGLYMGFIKQGKFLISLEFFEFLKQRGLLINEKKITVKERGERSILYGNDLSYGMITKASQDIKKDDEILIVNQQNEILAIGKYVLENEDLSDLQAIDKVAINIIDKGYYLRKKQ